MPRNTEKPTDWLETVVRVAGRLGLNEVRVRWKLIRLQQSLARGREALDGTVRHARYEHAICPRCGHVQSRGERECRKCGARLSARARQMVQRLGLVAPKAISVSSLIGLLLIAAYFRLMLARPSSGYLGADVDVVVQLGGYWLPALNAGEYWRYATAVFLHFGLWHLGFNLLALAQIGPTVEDVFGRGRTAFFFMTTGILSFAACHAWGMTAPSAGASGAVLGLIGVAAGWGQRDGTTVGRAVRNQMLTWLVYTTMFGLFLQANHIAHFAGFAAGSILGFLTPPKWLGRNSSHAVDAVLGLLGIALAIASTTLVVRPPTSSRAWIAPEASTKVNDDEENTTDDEDPSAPPSITEEHVPHGEAHSHERLAPVILRTARDTDAGQ